MHTWITCGADIICSQVRDAFDEHDVHVPENSLEAPLYLGLNNNIFVQLGIFPKNYFIEYEIHIIQLVIYRTNIA
jgi:hypothetical protein